MDVATMSRYEPRVAKKIFLYRNGIDSQTPKMVVVNDRQIRDFTTFLNRATSGIKAPVAVRNIYTPIGGHRIHKLQDLENGKHYVAGGGEHFKKLKYGAIYKQLHNKSPGKADIKTLPIRGGAIQAVSRFRNLPDKPYLIHIFRNGDALFHGVRVLLPKRIMNSWEHILELVTEKAELTLPAKRLCTVDGQVIHAVTDIRDGEKYVAVSGPRKFIKLPYTAIDPTPRSIRNPRIRHLTKQMTLPSEGTLTGTMAPTPPTFASLPDKPKQIKRLMPPKQHKGKNRPFAGRKNIEARNNALSDAREDSIFGGSPTLQDVDFQASLQDDLNTTQGSLIEPTSETEPQTETNIHTDLLESEIPLVLDKEAVKDDSLDHVIEKTDNDSSGQNSIFTKSEEPIQEADIIGESQDIEVERPVDEEEATQVVEDTHDEETKAQTNQDTTAIELQGETINGSVDLSVARVQGNEDSLPQVSNSHTGSTVNSKPGSRVLSQRETPTTSMSQLQTNPSQAQQNSTHHSSKDSSAVSTASRKQRFVD